MIRCSARLARIWTAIQILVHKHDMRDVQPMLTLQKLDRISASLCVYLWFPLCWVRALPSLAVRCTAIFVIETAAAQDPLPLPINADGSFDIPLGTELALGDSGLPPPFMTPRSRFPLHYTALGSDNQAGAALLLERGADPFQIDNDLRQHWTWQQAAEIRLERNCWPNGPSVWSYRLPTKRRLGGCSTGTGPGTRRLLRLQPCLTQTRKPCRGSSEVAEMSPSPEVMRLRLVCDADVRDAICAPLSAAKSPNPEVLESLLERGADTTYPTLLEHAACNRDQAVKFQVGRGRAACEWG